MSKLKQVSDHIREIAKEGRMHLPGRIYASRKLMQDMEGVSCVDRVGNVAHLPGIVNYSLAKPDVQLNR